MPQVQNSPHGALVKAVYFGAGGQIPFLAPFVSVSIVVHDEIESAFLQQVSRTFMIKVEKMGADKSIP